MLLRNTPRCIDCYHCADLSCTGAYCQGCSYEYVPEEDHMEPGPRRGGNTYTFSEQDAALSSQVDPEATSTAAPQLNPACNLAPVGPQPTGMLFLDPLNHPPGIGYPTPESLNHYNFSTNTTGTPAHVVDVGLSGNTFWGSSFDFSPQPVHDTPVTPWDTPSLELEVVEEPASCSGSSQTGSSKALAPQHIAALQQSRDHLQPPPSSLGHPPRGTRTGTPTTAPSQSTAQPSVHGSAATHLQRISTRQAPPSRTGAGQPDVLHVGTPVARASPCTEPTETPSLACPYLLHNPKKYRNCRTMTLKRIRDVKQHVRRDHQKAEDPEGVTAEQREILGQKPDRKLYKDMEAQWYLVWDIIFPHRKEERPSSPYLQDDITLLAASIQKNGKEFMMSHPQFGHLAPNQVEDTLSACLAMIAYFGGREPRPEQPDLSTHIGPTDISPSEDGSGPSGSPSISDMTIGVNGYCPNEEEIFMVPQGLGWDGSSAEEMLLDSNYQWVPNDYIS